MEGNKNIYGYGKIYLLCCSSVLHSLIPLSNTNLEHAAWSNTKELIKELALPICVWSLAIFPILSSNLGTITRHLELASGYFVVWDGYLCLLRGDADVFGNYEIVIPDFCHFPLWVPFFACILSPSSRAYGSLVCRKMDRIISNVQTNCW